MGRSKSWLALVLAIVMVLGMGVPTAFAAEPTTSPAHPGKLGFSDGSGSYVPVHELDFTTSSGAQTVYIHNLINDSSPTAVNVLSTSYLGGDTPELSFLDPGTKEPIPASVATFTVGDGYFTVKPVAVTNRTNVEVVVAKSSGWAGRWNGNPGRWLSGEFSFTNLPIGTYSAGKIELDKGVPGDAGFTITKDMFTASGAGNICIYDFRLLTFPNTLTYYERGKKNTNNFSIELHPDSNYTGVAFVEVTLNVGGVLTVPVVIPVFIGNSDSEMGYRVGTNVPKLTGKITDNGFSFPVYVAEKNGREMDTARLGFVFDAAVVDFDPSASLDVNGGLSRITTIYDQSNGTIRLVVPRDVIKAKGTILVTGSSRKVDNPSESRRLVPLVLDFEINPIKVTISADATSTLKFDKNKQTPDLTKYVYVTPVDSTGTPDMNDSETEFKPSNPGITDYAREVVTNKRGRYTLVADNSTSLTASTKFVVTQAVDYVAGTLNRGGTFWAEPVEIGLQVVDTTPVPAITAAPNPIVFDTNVKAPKLTQNVVLTASNFIKWTGYNLDDPKLTLTAAFDAPNAALNGGASVTFTQIGTTAQAEAIITCTAGAAKYKGNLVINGTVNNIAIPAVKIPVTIDESTTGAAHHLEASITAINEKQNANAIQFTVDMKDYAGGALPSNGATIPFAWVNAVGDPTVVADPAIADIKWLRDNIWEARFKQPKVGSGVIMFVGITTDPAAYSFPLYIPVNVGKLDVTVDPASYTFDLAYEAQTTTKLTLSANGVINETNIDSVMASAPGVTIAKVAAESTPSKLVYKVTADAETPKTTLTFSGVKVDVDIPLGFVGCETNTFTFNYEVKDTRRVGIAAPFADLTKLDFSFAPGGLQERDLQFVSLPDSSVKLTVISVTSSAPGVVSVEPVVARTNTYRFKALSDGVGFITVKAKVGLAEVEDFILPFSVGATVETKLTLSVVPSTLNLTTNKTAAVTVAATNGTLTDAAVVIDSQSPALEGATVIELSADGKTVTAVGIGSAVLKATGKINGVDAAAVTATVTVTETPDAGPGMYINGEWMDPSKVNTLYVANDYMIDGFAVTIQNASGTAVPATSLRKPTKETKRITLLRKAPLSFVPISFGKQTLTASAGASQYTAVIELKPLLNEKDKTIVGTLPAPKVGQIGRIFDYVTTEPANAFYTQPKFFQFKSSDCAIATVKANGLVMFKGAGTVTLAAKSLKGNAIIMERTLVVTDEYTTTRFRGAVLSTANTTEIMTAMSKANYQGGATHVVDVANTMAGFEAMIAEMKTACAEDDIFMLYVDTKITKSGIEFADGKLTLNDFALKLGAIPGKIVIMMNGSAANFFTGKDVPATNADVINAFAKADAAYKAKASSLADLYGGGYANIVPKFYVISATAKTAQTTSTARIDAFKKAFLEGIAIGTNGKMVVTDTDSITLNELAKDMKPNFKSNAPIAVYPSGSSLKVFMNRTTAAPANP